VAAVELVRRVRPELDGARALVMGRSAIVGKPAALLLLNLNASVTIGHSRSDVAALAKEAEVLIAATGAAGLKWSRYRKALAAWTDAGKGDGKPEPPDLTPLITKEMVRPGALVIDVGVNHVPKALDEAGEPVTNSKGRPAMQYVGDVDVEGVSEVAGWVTNPRGGAGPVTNAYLLVNTVRAAVRLAGPAASA
jgi:methylenetetrahydrofolate dehydrogenase (NADP+)/methenyltetrahydrofolate cyclohydrolase